MQISSSLSFSPLCVACVANLGLILRLFLCYCCLICKPSWSSLKACPLIPIPRCDLTSPACVCDGNRYAYLLNIHIEQRELRVVATRQRYEPSFTTSVSWDKRGSKVSHLAEAHIPSREASVCVHRTREDLSAAYVIRRKSL